MHLFYCPNFKNVSVLNEQESIHAIKVLRLKKGDIINVVDGLGGFFEAIIVEPHSKKCGLSMISERPFFNEKKYKIHIGIAPAKSNDRNEWFLEKCIEFGVDEVSFINCNRSERKSINMDRMTKLSISAIKQSLNIVAPKLNPVSSLKNFVSTIEADCRFIGHLVEGDKSSLFRCAPPEKSYVVLIGPEGDFDEKEIKFAIENNFVPISLGKNRLRTETAGIAACHILNLINE